MTSATSHTETESKVATLARDGIELMRKHDKNADFCVGASWRTLELILEALGEAVAPAPWLKAKSDE